MCSCSPVLFGPRSRTVTLVELPVTQQAFWHLQRFYGERLTQRVIYFLLNFGAFVQTYFHKTRVPSQREHFSAETTTEEESPRFLPALRGGRRGPLGHFTVTTRWHRAGSAAQPPAARLHSTSTLKSPRQKPGGTPWVSLWEESFSFWESDLRGREGKWRQTSDFHLWRNGKCSPLNKPRGG